MSASTVSPCIRGESLINDTSSGGMAAGTRSFIRDILSNSYMNIVSSHSILYLHFPIKNNNYETVLNWTNQ